MYKIQIIISINCTCSKKLEIFRHYSISMVEHVCPAHETHFGKHILRQSISKLCLTLRSLVFILFMYKNSVPTSEKMLCFHYKDGPVNAVEIRCGQS
jgi:hypothetical protein